jgi:hypothetical protein
MPLPDNWANDLESGVFGIAAAAEGGVGGLEGIKNDGTVANEDFDRKLNLPHKTWRVNSLLSPHRVPWSEPLKYHQ